jgi:hypothetical protein
MVNCQLKAVTLDRAVKHEELEPCKEFRIEVKGTMQR